MKNAFRLPQIIQLTIAYIMNNIDNGGITFENIVEKMELMKILILELQSDLKQDYTIEK